MLLAHDTNTGQIKQLGFNDGLDTDDVIPVAKSYSSIPDANNNDSVDQQCDMQGELGNPIGESIVSCILASQTITDIVVVGCGSVQVKPKCICQLKLSVYGHEVSMSTLIVSGQRDQMIIGINVIKYLLHQFKGDPTYWRGTTKAESSGELSIKHALRHDKMER